MGTGRISIETHRKYHVNGCSERVRCPRNLIRLNAHNSKSHEMKKAEVCYDLQKAGHDFITEACRNDNNDIIDVVDLSTGDEIEIINTHGLEKAVSNGRKVVKI